MTITEKQLQAYPKTKSGWRKLPNGNHVKIGAGVTVGKDIHIGNYVTIGDGVRIGHGVTIGNGTVIENAAKIGNGVLIPPFSRVTYRTKIPDGAIIAPTTAAAVVPEIASLFDAETVWQTLEALGMKRGDAKQLADAAVRESGATNQTDAITWCLNKRRT